GWKSQSHDDKDHNHWVMDDSPGQLRTRLASSHACAELHLGELIHHNPLSSTRGSWRGQGVELATQGWGTLRAPQGLLLSTQARSQAQGTQLDSAEALAQLKAAQDLGQRLTQAAAPAGAQALSQHDERQALDKLAQDLDPTRDGHHPDAVNGQDSRQPAPGSRTPDKPTPRTARPHLVL
ncbi:type VI secretion system Vgr family protein, partial [Roseateles sp. BYS87W]